MLRASLATLSFAASGCGENSGSPDMAMIAQDLAAATTDMAMAASDAMASDAAPPDFAKELPADMAPPPPDFVLADLATVTALTDLTAPPPDLVPLPPDMTPVQHVVVAGANGMLTFTPDPVVIKVGESVRWDFATGGHNVVSGSNGIADNKFCSPANQGCANAPPSPASTSYTFVFTNAGTYPYFDRFSFQQGMKGTITVQ